MKDTNYQNSYREINNLNWHISVKEMESRINNLPKKKEPQNQIFSLVKTFKEEMILTLQSIFQKTLSSTFHGDNIVTM